mmetsp:Transcript_34540/g.113749  ORF Transcript_34540/g.113749 Transcript_34540/m.113749 type:complete len:82 (-) Transcript_34540:20-265(-)
MTPSSLRSQVAALLGDLESALCAPLGSPDGSADADAVTAAAAPAAAAPAALPPPGPPGPPQLRRHAQFGDAARCSHTTHGT